MQTMKPEYDFSNGVRGKHYKALQQGHTVRINHSDGTHTIQYFGVEDDAVASVQGIPSNLLNELTTMAKAKDDDLWNAINPSVSPQQRDRLSELNAFGGERELTQAERNEQEALLMEHHRSILRRAQAIAILTMRGYSISDDSLLNSVL